MHLPPVVDHPLFFLDYDGTLAPIVDDPNQAYPHPDIPELLDALSARFPVFIVTGRYLVDLQSIFDRTLDAIGLHGVQRGRLGGGYTNTIPEGAKAAIDWYRSNLPSFEGLSLEDKGPMFAIHYRRVEDKEAARDAIRKWLKDVPASLDPIWGKDVVELRPSGISKGSVVREIAHQHEHRTPVYLGDDVTDEDAFSVLGDEAVTVKVGEGETLARYRLAGIDDVVGYLKQYVE
jgi:trehalose 6-phosphate phosphatase